MLHDVKLLASRSVGIDSQHVGSASPLRLEREETLVASYVEDGFPSQILGKLNQSQFFLAVHGTRRVDVVGQPDSLVPFEALEQVRQIGPVHGPPRMPRSPSPSQERRRAFRPAPSQQVATTRGSFDITSRGPSRRRATRFVLL